MKRHIILFIVFWGLSDLMQIEAQVPGYQGKKLDISLGISTFQALNNPNANGKSGVLSFNASYQGAMDITLGRKFSIGVGVQYENSMFKADQTYRAYLNYNEQGNETGNDLDISYPGVMGSISTWGFNLHLRKYFGSHIAPIGLYFKPEVIFTKSSIVFDSVAANKVLISNFADKGIILEKLPVLKIPKDISCFGMGITLGNRTMLFKSNFFLDTGFQIGIMLFKNMISFSPDNTDMSKYIGPEEYLESLVKKRVTHQYMMNFRLGVGFLVL